MSISSGMPAAAQDARLMLYGRAAPGRPRVEAFIRAVYARCYRARVRSFAPVLVGWEAGGELLACAGYRSALEPLFLERYLDQPIEAALAPSRPVSRAQVVEVGHLASLRAGEGRRLLLALAAHLSESNVEWVASTVTAELRQVVVRLGLGAVAIAPAHRERLGEEAKNWGSYFEHDPIVVAGHLPTALRTLRQRVARP